MHVFKLGAIRLRMTKKGIEESQIHLQIKSCKTTLTASEFRDLHEWFEEEETRLVRKSVVRAKKQAPMFALSHLSYLKQLHLLPRVIFTTGGALLFGGLFIKDWNVSSPLP